MFRVAICDDDESFLAEEEQLIHSFFDSSGISTEVKCWRYLSGTELANDIDNLASINLFLLDYQMEDIDGYSLAVMIRNKWPDAAIAFVSSIINVGPLGYRIGAMRFVVKGYDSFKDDLYECLGFVLGKYNSGLVEVVVKDRLEDKKVCIKDINCLESSGRNLMVHMVDDKTYNILKMTGKKAYEIYSKYGFIRIHKARIINPLNIMDYERYTVHLKGGYYTQIAQSQYDEFVRLYWEWKIRNL